MPIEENYKLWVLLHQARDAISRNRDNELRKFNVTQMQVAVLEIVKKAKQPATPAEISKWIFREPHTVSGLLNRMERAGLIKKTSDLKRKNMIRIEITEKGKKAYRCSEAMKTINKTMSCLTSKEKKNLEKYLRILRNDALGELGKKLESLYP